MWPLISLYFNWIVRISYAIITDIHVTFLLSKYKLIYNFLSNYKLKWCANKTKRLSRKYKIKLDNWKASFRRSPVGVLLGKGVLKIFSKFRQWKYAVKITLWYGCTPLILLHISRTPIYKNTFGGLLLPLEDLWPCLCLYFTWKTDLLLSLPKWKWYWRSNVIENK